MNQSGRQNQAAFITLISVFFFWGFVAASNTILIPVFKNRFHLEQWQSQMIEFAFYIAYTVGSVIYYVISRFYGDPLNRIGYRNGIALGLLISAVGAFFFYMAAEDESSNLMITGLFIIGLGFSLQQTAANPLTINIGDPAKGSQRLSLAGGINNVGTTIGPVLVGFAIFGSLSAGTQLDDISSVKVPYLVLGAAFILMAALFRFSSIPNHIGEKEERAKEKEGAGALSHPQLRLGMIAIFLYVGVEVSTASNLSEYMKQHIGTPESEVAPFLSLYWASIMIGRWISAASAFNLKATVRLWLSLLLPYAAFGIFILVNYLARVAADPSASFMQVFFPFQPYLYIIPVVIIAEKLSQGNPSRQLIIFSLLGIAALIIGMNTEGMKSVYAFISVGLFCSTLWPCIFTLAIAGLGNRTNEGAGFLIMMIMGGGIISWLQGFLSKDALLGIQYSYSIGVICFIYLAFYGWRAASLLRARGVSLKTENA